MRRTLLPSAGRAALPHLQIARASRKEPALRPALPRGETTEQRQEQPRHKLRPPPSRSLSETFQQHAQGHQLLLSPSGGERRMLETMAESHVKILTECSLQLSLSDVQPASPYGKHGHVSGQGKSFGHAGFAPCMVSKHKPQLSHSQYRGTKQEPSARVHKAGGTRLSREGCCQRGLHGSTRSGSKSPATPRRDAES